MNEEFLINLWNYRKKVYLCSVQHIIQEASGSLPISRRLFLCLYARCIYLYSAIQPRGSKLMPSRLPLVYVEQREVDSRFSIL